MHWNITGFLVLKMKSRSTALRIATLVFMFILCIRFLVSDSLTGVLRKRYGHDLVQEVRKLEQFWI